jgi:hypothetical protein
MLRKIVGAFILLALIFAGPILSGESDAKPPGQVLGMLAMFTICAGILWGITTGWKAMAQRWSAKPKQARIDPANDKA